MLPSWKNELVELLARRERKRYEVRLERTAHLKAFLIACSFKVTVIFKFTPRNNDESDEELNEELKNLGIPN